MSGGVVDRGKVVKTGQTREGTERREGDKFRIDSISSFQFKTTLMNNKQRGTNRRGGMKEARRGSGIERVGNGWGREGPSQKSSGDEKKNMEHETRRKTCHLARRKPT